MPKMRFIKITTDVLLALLLLATLAYPWTGRHIHTWVVYAWAFVVLLHAVWNRGWYASLWRGSYSPPLHFNRRFGLAVVDGGGGSAGVWGGVGAFSARGRLCLVVAPAAYRECLLAAGVVWAACRAAPGGMGRPFAPKSIL